MDGQPKNRMPPTTAVAGAKALRNKKKQKTGCVKHTIHKTSINQEK